MRNLHCRLATLILILLAGLLQTGCHENVLINSKIAPSLNTLGVYSTSLPVITHTYYDDTAITSVNIGGIPIFQAVGSITDPYFGTMTGATFFQVIPQDNTADLFAGQTVDSAVLVLPYSGLTYGDTATQTLTQSYQVFYVQDPMSLDSTYYSYSTKAINTSFPLSDPTPVNIYHIKDSFLLNQLAINYPALRIKLKLTPTFDSLFMPAQRKLEGSTSPFTDFINAFNGLCVRVSDTRQATTAMPYFQLDGPDIYSSAGILVYYHTTGAADTASFVQSYHFDRTYCAHFNNVTKSYRQYPVNSLLTSTAANDQYIALQNLPGPAVDVVIPGITSLPKGIINKAELQLTMLDDASNPPYYEWPEALYPIGVGTGNYPAGIISGLTYNLADYYPLTSTSPLSILDGTYHQITRANGKTYNVFTINIPREVMSSIQAKNDTLHLHINGSQDFYGAFHMVAGGGAHPDSNYRPKLFVVYSKL